MERIFISSLARGEMGPIRKAAAKAVEALDMVPIMFETGGASGEDSRRALLDRVASSDAIVLLLGAQYGEAVERGVSPTKEDFNEAIRRNIPVLALVQDIEREQAQGDFLRRVRGGWEEGRLTADFKDAADVGFAVTKSLNAWRREREGGDTAPAAMARALELARGDERAGTMSSGSKLRVAVRHSPIRCWMRLPCAIRALSTISRRLHAPAGWYRTALASSRRSAGTASSWRSPPDRGSNSLSCASASTAASWGKGQSAATSATSAAWS